jgi:hypothetical protein
MPGKAVYIIDIIAKNDAFVIVTAGRRVVVLSLIMRVVALSARATVIPATVMVSLGASAEPSMK